MANIEERELSYSDSIGTLTTNGNTLPRSVKSKVTTTKRISDNLVDRPIQPLKYNCVYCSKKLASLAKKLEHEDTHEILNETKTYKCDECRVSFRNKVLLRKHACAPKKPTTKATKSKSNEKPKQKRDTECNANLCRQYQCPVCQKCFSSTFLYERHYVGQHSKIKPYACKECGCRYSYSDSLRGHNKLEKKHLTKGRYPCEQCQRVFTNGKCLNQHKRVVHSKSPSNQSTFGNDSPEGQVSDLPGKVENEIVPKLEEKPFLCDICGECFVIEVSLLIHKESHVKFKKDDLTYGKSHRNKLIDKRSSSKNYVEDDLNVSKQKPKVLAINTFDKRSSENASHDTSNIQPLSNPDVITINITNNGINKNLLLDARNSSICAKQNATITDVPSVSLLRRRLCNDEELGSTPRENKRHLKMGGVEISTVEPKSKRPKLESSSPDTESNPKDSAVSRSNVIDTVQNKWRKGGDAFKFRRFMMDKVLGVDDTNETSPFKLPKLPDLNQKDFDMSPDVGTLKWNDKFYRNRNGVKRLPSKKKFAKKSAGTRHSQREKKVISYEEAVIDDILLEYDNEDGGYLFNEKLKHIESVKKSLEDFDPPVKKFDTPPVQVSTGLPTCYVNLSQLAKKNKRKKLRDKKLRDRAKLSLGNQSTENEESLKASNSVLILSRLNIDPESLDLTCVLCERRFTTLDRKKRHLFKSHKTRPYQCKGCDLMFPSKTNLSRHYLGQHIGNYFHCEFCELSFNYNDTLNHHIRRNHSDTLPFGCDLCANRFEDQSDVKDHKRLAHMCQYCGKLVADKYEHEKRRNCVERRRRLDYRAMANGMPDARMISRDAKFSQEESQVPRSDVSDQFQKNKPMVLPKPKASRSKVVWKRRTVNRVTPPKDLSGPNSTYSSPLIERPDTCSEVSSHLISTNITAPSLSDENLILNPDSNQELLDELVMMPIGSVPISDDQLVQETIFSGLLQVEPASVALSVIETERTKTLETISVSPEGIATTGPSSSKGTNKVDRIFSEGTNKVDPISSEGTNKADPIISEGTNKADPIISEGTNKADPITSEGTNKADPITSEGTNKADRIISEGTNKADLIISEGTNKSDPIISEGTNKADLIISEGTNKADLMISEGTNKAGPMISEGTNKADPIISEGTNKADPIISQATDTTGPIISQGTPTLSPLCSEAPSTSNQYIPSTSDPLLEVSTRLDQQSDSEASSSSDSLKEQETEQSVLENTTSSDQNEAFEKSIHDQYLCPHCGKEFPELKKKNSHEYNVHRRRKKVRDPPAPRDFKFSCRFCERKFTTRSGLGLHVRNSHSGKKPKRQNK